MHAAVWDYDGTVMDTYPVMVPCLCEALRARGAEGVDETEMLTLMKDSLSQAVSVACARWGLEAEGIYRDFRILERGRMHLMRPVADMPEVLTKLKDEGYRHFLFTHRDRSALTGLESCGLLGLFEDAVTSECAFARKPDPEGLLHLLKTYGLPADGTWMIGDRPLDVRAGRAAGVRTCLLDPEDRFPKEPCDIRVHDAREILLELA
mgnify:CR=1 FL=1